MADGVRYLNLLRDRFMANPDHLSKLLESVETWNAWRHRQPVKPNLSGANFTKADFTNAYLAEANLAEADLSGANLTGAKLWQAVLSGSRSQPCQPQRSRSQPCQAFRSERQ